MSLNISEGGDLVWKNKSGDWHRKEGPAAIHINGCIEYWFYRKLHRLNGPAIIYQDYYIAYCVNGDFHRLDGPARIWSNGAKEYWIHGKKYSKEDYYAKVKKL